MNYNIESYPLGVLSARPLTEAEQSTAAKHAAQNAIRGLENLRSEDSLLSKGARKFIDRLITQQHVVLNAETPTEHSSPAVISHNAEPELNIT